MPKRKNDLITLSKPYYNLLHNTTVWLGVSTFAVWLLGAWMIPICGVALLSNPRGNLILMIVDRRRGGRVCSEVSDPSEPLFEDKTKTNGN